VQTENAEVNNGLLQKAMNLSSSFAKGIYLTRILVNDKVYTMKLVYEK
jgi:hypothetical protein